MSSLHQSDFRAKWIGTDATFGSDIDFLNALPKQLYYFAAIRSNTQVFTKKPKLGLPAYKGRGRRPSKTRVLPGQAIARRVSEVAKSARIAWKRLLSSKVPKDRLSPKWHASGFIWRATDCP
jgi:SRSO17 transposase